VSELRFYAIIPTSREWWNRVLSNASKSIFHFPPNKKPRVMDLSEGDICFVYVYDDGCIAGYFRVKEVKELSADEFQDIKSRAVEVPQAPFPVGNQKCRIIEFHRETLKKFKNPIPISIVEEITLFMTRRPLGPRFTRKYDVAKHPELFSLMMLLGSLDITEISLNYTKDRKELTIKIKL